MRNFLRSARAVLIAYFVSDLIRSRGLIYGLLSLAVWLSMFTVPASLFVRGGIAATISTGILIGMAILLAYSTATWDWAMLLRWLIQLGVLEYVVASGSPILAHFLGTVPVSVTWYLIALGISYAIVSLFLGPPVVTLVDPVVFVAGVFSLLLVLLAYSLLLGGAILSAGTVGPVVEFISWLLPIATGGILPLELMPAAIRIFAYVTPFSYPAELLRYSLGVSRPAIEPGLAMVIGAFYSSSFLAISMVYLRYQLRKLLKEGVKTAALF